MNICIYIDEKLTNHHFAVCHRYIRVCVCVCIRSMKE